MSVFRVEKDKNNPYIMLNVQFLNDENLSLKAKGLLSYFLSKPDGWQFYQKEIKSKSKDGEDSIRTAIKELVDNGYVVRALNRNEKGALVGGYNYTIYEKPPILENPYMGKSRIGKIKA